MKTKAMAMIALAGALVVGGAQAMGEQKPANSGDRYEKAMTQARDNPTTPRGEQRVIQREVDQHREVKKMQADACRSPKGSVDSAFCQ